MGGYQNYGPFLGTLNIRARIIMGTQKGTIILTTTHIGDNIGEYLGLTKGDTRSSDLGSFRGSRG